MIALKSTLAWFALGALPFALLASPDSAAAAPANSSSHPTGRSRADRPAAAIFLALDLDGNGVLSAAEIDNAPTLLAALDTNRDGVLSPVELRQAAGARPMHARVSPAARATRLNLGSLAFNVAFTLHANRDGEIQTMQIANAASSLKTLDLNGDGELTPDELQPASSSMPTAV